MKGSGPAWMIQADAKVGIKAQNPGNRLSSLMIHTVNKIDKVPIIDRALFIFVF